MIDYGLSLLQTSANEPLTLAEVKDWLRIDHSFLDTQISFLLTSARQRIEKEINRSIVEKQWKLTLWGFPRDYFIVLPYGPVKTINQIYYFDENGILQTLSSTLYKTLLDYDPPKVYFSWNTPLVEADKPNAVQVFYTAGYTDVPSSLKEAILALIAWRMSHLGDQETKEISIPSHVQAMLNPYSMDSYA